MFAWAGHRFTPIDADYPDTLLDSQAMQGTIDAYLSHLAVERRL